MAHRTTHGGRGVRPLWPLLALTLLATLLPGRSIAQDVPMFTFRDDDGKLTSRFAKEPPRPGGRR